MCPGRALREDEGRDQGDAAETEECPRLPENHEQLGEVWKRFSRIALGRH